MNSLNIELNEELSNIGNNDNFINNPNFKLEHYIAIENNKQNNKHKTKSLELCIDLTKKIFYILTFIIVVAFIYELKYNKTILTDKYTTIFINLFSTLIGFVIGKEFK